MGCACLSKAAPEQKGQKFPKLTELNTEEFVLITCARKIA